MAKSEIGALRATMGMDTAKFEAGARKVKKEVGTIEGRFKSFKGAAGGLVAGMVGALSVDMLVGLARRGLDYAASLGEIAEAAGVSTKFLQEFRFAATQNGATLEQADGLLEKFTLNLGKGGKGVAALGVSLTDANGKTRDSAAIFADVAQKISEIEDPTRRAAAAQAVFGKQYASIMPLLNQGAAGFKASAAEAHKFGIVLTDQQIQDADKTADKIEALQTAISMRISGAVASNADAIGRLVENLAKLIENLGMAAAAAERFSNSSAGKLLSKVNQGAKYLSPFGPQMGVIWDAATASAPAKPAPAKPAAAPSRAEFFKQPMRPIGGGRFSGMAAALSGIDPQMLIALSRETVEAMGVEFDALPARIEPPFMAARSVSMDEVEQLKAQLQQQTEDVLRSIFPDDYARAKLQADLATLDQALADKLISHERWFAAKGRLLMELRDLDQQIQEAGALISSDDLQKQIDASMEGISGTIRDTLGGEAKKTTAQVVQDFAGMAQGVLSEMDGLSRSIKDGDFFGIMMGVLSLIERISGLINGGNGGGGFQMPMPGAGGGWGRGLPGFATGGSFTVGGALGIDRNLVAFRATAGEQVTVTRPGQSIGPAGGDMVFDLRGAVVTAELLAQMNQMVAAGEARAITGGANAAMKGMAKMQGRTLR